MSSSKVKIQPTLRDRKILTFLWRWKLVSTAALYARYFASAKPMAAYNRLKKLENSGLVRQELIHHSTQFAWAISRKGFNFIKEDLPQLKRGNFKSDAPYHDALVTAIHLGEWLVDVPGGVKSFSEQQMKTYFPEHYPNWLPDIESHRPDGFWCISRGGSNKVTALEVQRSAQSKGWWESVQAFYDLSTGIDQVIWVCESSHGIKTLGQKFCMGAQGDRPKHFVFSLKDLFDKGWTAPSLFGPDQLKIFSELLDEGGMNGRENFLTRFLLDFRKSPVNLKEYDPQKNSKKLYDL